MESLKGTWSHEHFSGQKHEATKSCSPPSAASEKGDLTLRSGSLVAATKNTAIPASPCFDSKGDLIGEILVLTVKADDFEEVLKYETGKF